MQPINYAGLRQVLTREYERLDAGRHRIAETTGVQKGLADTKTGINNLGKQSQTSGGMIGGLKGQLMGLINPTTLAIGAVSALTGFMLKSSKAAAEAAQVDGAGTLSIYRRIALPLSPKIDAPTWKDIVAKTEPIEDSPYPLFVCSCAYGIDLNSPPQPFHAPDA